MKADNAQNEIPVCRRCGRKLRSEKSRSLGMGEVCYQKTMRENTHKKLFTPLQNIEKSV